MTGVELKEFLIDERVKFVALANFLKIAPTSLQSRLRSQRVSSDFIEQIEEYLKVNRGYIANKIAGKSIEEPKQIPTTESSDKSQSNALILLCQKQSDQISDLLDQQRRLIAIIEQKNQNK